MEDEVSKWLTDIQEAIGEINEFLPVKKDFLEFKNDKKQDGPLNEISK